MLQRPRSQPSARQNTKAYYNPVHKIRNLILTLDNELNSLVKQASYIPPSVKTVPDYILDNTIKRIPSRTVAGKVQTNSRITSHSNFSSHNNSQNKMLGVGSDTKATVSGRTLSSIYRSRVLEAYRNKRIFTVIGSYNTIRRALLRRGWLEKLPPNRYPKLQGLSEDVLLHHAKKGNDYEAVAISKIINNFPAFFVWQPKQMRDLYGDVLPYRNRVRRSNRLDFSTKVGLIGCAEEESWFRQPGLCCMRYPRFYRLNSSVEERQKFVEDFRLTQCRSLLRWLVDNSYYAERICSETKGTIHPDVLMFALGKVNRELLKYDQNDELDDFEDTSSEEDSKVKAEWNNFLVNAQSVLHRKALFKASYKEMQENARVALGVLDSIEKKRPEFCWDGCKNLWILKPGYACRGNGIVIKNNLSEILTHSAAYPNRRYIAQKYIGEFDII